MLKANLRFSFLQELVKVGSFRAPNIKGFKASSLKSEGDTYSCPLNPMLSPMTTKSTPSFTAYLEVSIYYSVFNSVLS